MWNKTPVSGGGGSIDPNSHTHPNKVVLDLVTQPMVDNTHGHTNKAALDRLGVNAGQLTIDGQIGRVDSLSGLKWGIFGSSVSAANFPTGTTKYFQYIKSRTGIMPTTVSVAGSMVRSTQANYTLELNGNQLLQIDQMALDFDIITGIIGANDENNDGGSDDLLLGTFVSRDVMTFYGGLHILCQKLLDKYPEKPIGICAPQYYPSNNTAQSTRYHNAIKEVCNYYAIPFIDLAVEGKTPYGHPTFKNNYVYSDGLHLTSAGNEILSYSVETFLRRIAPSTPLYINSGIGYLLKPDTTKSGVQTLGWKYSGFTVNSPTTIYEVFAYGSCTDYEIWSMNGVGANAKFQTMLQSGPVPTTVDPKTGYKRAALPAGSPLVLTPGRTYAVGFNFTGFDARYTDSSVVGTVVSLWDDNNITTLKHAFQSATARATAGQGWINSNVYDIGLKIKP